jgi:hypothetical protein
MAELPPFSLADLLADRPELVRRLALSVALAPPKQLLIRPKPVPESKR